MQTIVRLQQRSFSGLWALCLIQHTEQNGKMIEQEDHYVKSLLLINCSRKQEVSLKVIVMEPYLFLLLSGP